MLTRWGRNMQPDNVLDEYPRPQMTRPSWLNLNGRWQYAIVPRTAPLPEQWDGNILVPFCVESALSGVARSVGPEEALVYRRNFQLAPATDKRTLLHFGAVDYECSVWINGGLVGTHQGGFDAFHFDITTFARVGNNELIVRVTDPTSSSDQPRGKQHLKPQGIWYTPVTGIWQTVWIEQVPLAAHIDELSITVNDQCDAIDVIGFLNRPSRNPELALQLRVSLAGELITETTARPDRLVRLSIPEPQLWSPKSPTLYDVDVRLIRIRSPLPERQDQRNADQLNRDVPQYGMQESAFYADADISRAEEIDRVGSYFGLRSIRVACADESGHPALLLNDEPLFQLGPLDQGWWPDGLHTPPSDEAIIYELEYLKAAGFNTVRKHIKVEPARYYYHCDRLGLLVWQDMPSGFLPAQFVAPNDEAEGLRSSRSADVFESELRRMVSALKCHPSIVVWVLHNEGWGQFDSRRLSNYLRGLDPGRLINATSGWRDMAVGDMIDRHDYQPQPTAPEADGQRALVIGEYGGIGWPVEAHLWNPDMRNWGYQTLHSREAVQAAYRTLTDAIVRMQQQQGLAAAIYTQTTDVEGEVNGLLSYDREFEKLSPEWLSDVHQQLTGNTG